MTHCPNCGAELPEPTHIGLRPKREYYISEPIELSPGTKYRRYFSIIYLPEKRDEAGVTYQPCIVVASEERGIDSDRTFVAGAKFYPDELEKLRRAWEDVMVAYMAFKASLTTLNLSSIFVSELRSLYESRQRRADLSNRALEMLRKINELKKV